MASDPAYVTAFKKLTKGPPRVEDIGLMEEEFYGANDRSTGVLFGSWVDMALESAIKSVMRPDLSSTVAKKLLGSDGHVGTFSAKTELAFALGIFGPKTYKDISLIRLVRNEFAHCRLPLRFEIAEVKAICDNLQIPETEAKTSPFLFASLARSAEMLDNPIDENHPKQRFIVACHSIIFGLLEFANRQNKNPPQVAKLP